MITVHALLLQMYFTLTANRQPIIMDVLFFNMKGTRNRGNQSNYRNWMRQAYRMLCWIGTTGEQ